MKPKKIVIVGGVAGGATAAARLRRLDETAEIVLFERGEHISFANCGLPYYIGETITSRKALLVQTVDGMSKKFNMDIRNRSEVVRINRDAKTVTVHNLGTRETYDESYDVLILSPGAKPIMPAIPGIDEAEQLFTLRNIPDTDRIKEYVDTHKPARAVIVGGGFIGLEMAENLHDRGVAVTLVQRGNQVMTSIDYELAAMLHTHMREKGVDLILEDEVETFEDRGRTVNLKSGRRIVTDMILLAIGVEPENQLAKDAGLALGVRNATKVNATLQTTDPSIYAIGDAIEVTDFVSGKPTMIPLAWPANRQGRLVADHINGLDVAYRGTMGTSIAKVFDLTVASTGMNEKALQRLSIPYEAVHIHPNSHAGYYPGASPISLKLLFNREDGTIYGAQAVGRDGVDKRIDVIAVAIKAGMTVRDLPDLELSYAPPYSSAKDPVNMAGYVALNIMDGLSDIVQWHQIDDIVADGGLLIDVREPIEREMGFIPGSINIPLGDIRERMDEIPKEKPVYVSCQVGLRGYLAARILRQYGYQVYNVDGGYKTYSNAFQPQKHQPVATNDSGVAEIKGETQAVKTDAQPIEASVTLSVNACGLQCPGPIMQVYENMQNLNDGDILEVKATDPGFARDIAAWCKNTGNTLVSSEFDQNTCIVKIRKGCDASQAVCNLSAGTQKNATLVVFSGDLDKAMASFIIASGAAAMGKKVTMFFTFWGLNILRRPDAPKVEKDSMEKMFGMMMPKGAGALPLSKMNMGGMGTVMMKKVMSKKNVDDLDTLIANAKRAGVKMIACTMSMDVMGIKAEEFIDGVELGGVATYLGETEGSGLNLFI
ncbi:CoA-disulfide reductase [Aneurinibacillus soli]|uniref:Coenzyme A disulfide reductase n=1 Tax=Aneurinibacillus soli TaxID=1500254 RepID=A0A0U5AXK6_9BACL|nr:CoA-disulfide reductase [Aneurinibacillus soli]PYE61677.1 CoA-disulfide reductase [Aneurinibacillus soli]BAU28465.1 Coenzyme A disulfide reductase [Aneurinibacillus soli]